MYMKIDDVVLEEIAEAVKRYCSKQAEVTKDYYASIKSLESDWSGENFDYLLGRVNGIDKGNCGGMEGINKTYHSYFMKKAKMIRNRPAFGGGAYSSAGSSSSTAGAGSSQKTVFDKVFESYNKEVVTKIYTYLRKINFYVPNEKIYFYDPFGKSKRGLYKNIMAIDINSPTFKQDMISLTGQHLFFQTQHFQQMELIRNLGVELNNKSLLNSNELRTFVEQIKLGKGIETKYLSFPDDNTRTAFNFFTKAFQATMSNDLGEVDKYKKYFSNSYGNFREILHNLISY